MEYGPHNAKVRVFTFKEGVLSKLAHDLRIRVDVFAIEVDPGSISATFDATSLKVDTAMRRGKPSSLLPQRFHQEIEQSIRGDVLRSHQFSEVSFQSTNVTEEGVAGTLALCGVSRTITVKRQGSGFEFLLHQPDFGIRPFTAMMGTLKIKPDIRVEVELLG